MASTSTVVWDRARSRWFGFTWVPYCRALLVLLDLTLPDSNGVQFCAQVRRRADWQELPIIVLSGQNSDEWRDAALAAGADDYVSKPFDLSELLDRVQQLLD